MYMCHRELRFLFRLVKHPIGNWTLHSVLSSLQEHKHETHWRKGVTVLLNRDKLERMG